MPNLGETILLPATKFRKNGSNYRESWVDLLDLESRDFWS